MVSDEQTQLKVALLIRHRSACARSAPRPRAGAQGSGKDPEALFP